MNFIYLNRATEELVKILSKRVFKISNINLLSAKAS